MSDTTTANPEALVDEVKKRYGRIASREDGSPSPGAGCCSSEAPLPASSTALGYEAEELATVPEGADLGVGCGAPIAELGLEPGESALDLGSGGGLDAFLAARRVAPGGRVYGVDMTPEMIERARRNAEKGGYANVEFRLGRLERLPIDDASIDAVTSNCVINLVPDKEAVFREVARVLKPGGRLVVSDIMLARDLPETLAKSVTAYVGCVSGALERERYFAIVRAAGLAEIEVLRDVDFLATLSSIGGELPEEVREVLDASGLAVEDLADTVRSVTFRAFKPSG